MSPALRERLGVEATAGLLHMLDVEQEDWRADVTELAAARFERRLVEETSGLRVQLAEAVAGLRTDIAHEVAGLRTEIGQAKVDLLKWSFAFWVGQVVVMAALLRMIR